MGTDGIWNWDIVTGRLWSLGTGRTWNWGIRTGGIDVMADLGKSGWDDLYLHICILEHWI